MISSVRNLLGRMGIFFALIFLAVLNSSAHDVGLSTATVRLRADKAQTELTFAIRDVEALADLDADHDGKVTANEFAKARTQLDKLFAAKCTLRCDADMVAPDSVRCQLDDTNNVVVRLEFPGRQFKELQISFDVIRDMTPGHRMFVSLLGPQGETLAERLVSQDSPSISVVLDAANGTPQSEAPQTFLGFLKLGIEHIGTGYDHLLFLFGLLIVAKNFRSSLLIISCFTVAHTITLGVATFGLFALRPTITEPAIALSIVYVGVENLLRHGEPKGRWLLTFAFGLIHGFGFASVLRDLGVGANGGGVAMPLFSFNLGVEVGQLTIAAIVLPIIWKLRQKENFMRRFVPACSVIVASLGAWWFVQRVWGS
ncbi:MAG: HupE/UreJ family protein [Verrucomicrobia bacterium]|nr:MAG: HupE/UreJ family protein [Verrucomicrobiota bacterium]